MTVQPYRPRIVVLVNRLRQPGTPSPLAQLIEQLAPRYADSMRLELIETALAEAAGVARALEHDNRVDAFVCTGASAAYLRQHVRRPVLPMRVGGRDLLRALDQARVLSNKVAILSYPHVSAELERMGPLFTVQIRQRSYTSLAEARACVAEAAADGYRTIIGSAMVLELAQQAGLDGVLALSRDALCEALDDAVAMCRSQRAESAKREQLDAVLQHITDGVIAVDALGQVQSINPAMATLLGVRADWACGRALAEVAPGLDARDVLRSGLGEESRVIRIGQRTLVANLAPIHDAGRLTGAVLTCQEMTAIQRADRRLRNLTRPSHFTARYELEQIIGPSDAIGQVVALARQYARTDATVLISGESGTGKELLAQGIHNAGPRRGAPFVAINCAAFPDTLLESELFGYEEGAFSGARKGGKMGLFEAAHGGTVFLDEIGDMPVPLQTRLLRVLQEREVLRLGGSEPVPIDVRVIAASHCDIAARIGAGAFRADLYYRINVLRLTAPPLRERGGDIAAIARAILGAVMTPDQMAARGEALLALLMPHLARYRWPGNIRELENILERAALSADALCSAEEEPVRVLRNLVPEFFGRDAAPDEPPASLRANSSAFAAEHINAVLGAANGNLDEAARQLGISRTTLWRRLRSLGAAPPGEGRDGRDAHAPRQ